MNNAVSGAIKQCIEALDPLSEDQRARVLSAIRQAYTDINSMAPTVLIRSGTAKETILLMAHENPGGIRQNDVTKLGISRATVSLACQKLVSLGLLRRDGNGSGSRYFATNSEDLT